MEYTAQEGKDYLTNHYAVLQVAVDATFQQIKAAYRQQAQQWHPDKYAHLAPQMRVQAGKRMEAINKAYALLSNQRSRMEYDALLSSWTGLISMDGSPMMTLGDLKRLGYAQGLLFDSEGWSSAVRAELDELKNHTRFNSRLFTRMENMYGAEKYPDEELKLDYQQVLRGKLLQLSLEESTWRDAVGLQAKDATTNLPSVNYLQLAEQSISERREQLAVEVQQLFGLLQSGSASSLLLRGDFSSIPVTAITVESLLRHAMDQYDVGAGHIRELATQRETYAKQLVELLSFQYLLEPQYGPTVIICVQIGTENDGHTMWFQASYIDDQLKGTLYKTGHNLDYNSTICEAQASGYDIITFVHEEFVSIQAELEHVLNIHFQIV